MINTKYEVHANTVSGTEFIFSVFFQKDKTPMKKKKNKMKQIILNSNEHFSAEYILNSNIQNTISRDNFP